MRTRIRRPIAALAALALLAVPALSRAAANPPALFQVGAGSSSLTPPPGVTVYPGGFGSGTALNASNETAPDNKLYARAVYISNGTHAISMVLVDSQGLFAALQEASNNPATSALGIDGMRSDAATKITALGLGPAMSQQDIIVQGSHSHSAPTAMGIWGYSDPRYLQLIHDGVVNAIVQAAQSRRNANVQYAHIDGSFLDNVNNQDTDSYSGWVQDGQTSILRAVDPSTGETIATYSNIPAHPDLLNGGSCHLLTADYFGRVRAMLEQRLGGTAIVGGATLGREESPVQSQGCSNTTVAAQTVALGWMNLYGDTVAELLTRALAENGRWVVDNTINSAQQMTYAPGWNAALFALVLAYKVNPQQSTVLYPINRSTDPPYQIGNTVGTPTTALRLGSIAYISLNGEALPEVRHAIAQNVYGADMIVGLSLGNDQLGYYSPAHTWVWQNGVFPYGSDHLEYNVSPVLGDMVVQSQVANLKSLGFGTSPVAVPLPEDNNWMQATQPGVQFLASPARADAGPNGTATINLDAIYKNAAINGGSISGQVHFDLGDGTTVDCCQGGRLNWFPHSYAPGIYQLRATATDSQGRTTVWPPMDHPEWGRLVVYPALSASIASTGTAPGTLTLTAGSAGGSGQILAYRWTFSDASVAYGRTVSHVMAPGDTATVTITDATGTMATSTVAA